MLVLTSHVQNSKFPHSRKTDINGQSTHSWFILVYCQFWWRNIKQIVHRQPISVHQPSHHCKFLVSGLFRRHFFVVSLDSIFMNNVQKCAKFRKASSILIGRMIIHRANRSRRFITPNLKFTDWISTLVVLKLTGIKWSKHGWSQNQIQIRLLTFGSNILFM